MEYSLNIEPKVNCIKDYDGGSMKSDIEVARDMIENIIKEYLETCKKDLKTRFTFDKLEEYKAAKTKIENLKLISELEDNILNETSFDINKLKKNRDESKISGEQYDKLVKLYEKTVLAELDVIIKNLNEPKVKDEDKGKTEEFKVDIENGPTDKIKTKIDNLSKLSDEKVLKDINDKVKEIVKKFTEDPELKKVYNNNNVFNVVDKTISDVIKAIDDSKNKELNVTLTFTVNNNCEFKSEYNKLSSSKETVKFINFEDLLNKIKQLTGDTENSKFTIKKGNEDISNKVGINDNDNLTVILGEKSNAVICKKLVFEHIEEPSNTNDENTKTETPIQPEQKTEEKAKDGPCCKRCGKK